MLTPPLLAAAFLFAGLSLCVLAFLLSRQDSSGPKLRFVAIVTAVLGGIAFAVALRLWSEIRLAAKTAARAPEPAYGTQAGTRTGAHQTDRETYLLPPRCTV